MSAARILGRLERRVLRAPVPPLRPLHRAAGPALLALARRRAAKLLAGEPDGAPGP